MVKAALISFIAVLITTTAFAQGAGPFTAEQAKRGQAAYQSRCASCHGSNLKSTDGESGDLSGAAFKFQWQGKMVAEKFATIRTTMPLDKPGSLDDQTYLDIISYILQFNGYMPSSVELKPGILEGVVIQSP